MPAEATPPVAPAIPAAPTATPFLGKAPEAPAAPATPETPPAPDPATPPAVEPPSMMDFHDMMMTGLGLAVGEPPVVPVVQTPGEMSVGLTLSDSLKVIDEKRAAPPAPAPVASAAETPPVVPPVQTPETPPAPPVAPPPVAVERRQSTESIVEATVKKVLEQQKPAEAPAPAAPVVTPPDPFEATLTEAEREQLDLARYAAKANPEKFGNQPTKVLESYKKLATYIEKAREKDPERTFDANDQEFNRFLESNRPWTPLERHKVEMQRVRDEVKAEVKQESEATLQELRQRQHLLEATPKIERGTAEYANGVHAFIAGDEKSVAAPILKLAAEQGWNKAVESDPLFAPIARDLTSQSVTLATEYLAITEGVKQFDGKNEAHMWLLRFVRQQGDSFARDGGDAKVRNGKTFLPMAEFNELAHKDPAKAQNHFTFTPRDVLERLAGNTKYNIEKTIATEQDRLEKAGFRRQAPAAAPPAVPQPTAQAPKPTPAEAPRSSPKAAPSSAPGAAQSSVIPPSSIGATLLSVMGVKQ